jgi:hypothetical protein
MDESSVKMSGEHIPLVVDANLPVLPEHEKVRQRLKSYCIELNSVIVEYSKGGSDEVFLAAMKDGCIRLFGTIKQYEDLSISPTPSSLTPSGRDLDAPSGRSSRSLEDKVQEEIKEEEKIA